MDGSFVGAWLVPDCERKYYLMKLIKRIILIFISIFLFFIQNVYAVTLERLYYPKIVILRRIMFVLLLLIVFITVILKNKNIKVNNLNKRLLKVILILFIIIEIIIILIIQDLKSRF